MYAIILALALEAQTLFAANGLPCEGDVCVSYYLGISGAKVADLKAAAKFPNNPDSIVSRISLDVTQSLPDHGMENFGVMLQAWIRAPQSSQYTFSTFSDDASEVWVNPVAAQQGDETDMVKVVELTSCCQKITGTTEIAMEEGKSYYLLAYMKEATGQDYLKIGMTAQSNNVEYFPISAQDNALGFRAPSGCVSGDSEFTQKTLLKLDQAQEKFGECDASVHSISGSIKKLDRVATVINTTTDTMSKIIGKVNNVTDMVLKDRPRGLGLTNTLGKIPKVGIFIKMGLKAVEKVVDGLDPLAETIANHASRIKSAVGVTGKLFKRMKLASTPTSLYLKGSHKILEAAHSCGRHTGYQCGTSSALMEAKNEAEYPEFSNKLDAIREVGVTCHAVLNPMDVILKELARIGEAIVDHLMAPLLRLLEAVKKVIDYMDEQITKFMKALKESEELQCALEIFEPVTDVVNLLTCPIDEVVGFIMHNLIDVMFSSLNEAINNAVIVGVNVAVEALIPDDLYVVIPDFTAIIPTQFWIDTCETAAIAFPGYATTIGTITSLDLPKIYSGREIKDEILGDAFAGMLLEAMEGGYESACKEAWNEMGTDFENCEKVIEKITDALLDASCAASEAALAVQIELLDAQQSVYNVARDHFEDAQQEFVEAQDDLADAYHDLDSAFDSVQAEKANCPRCRCGGCATGDIDCHLEGVWCCPARHGCLAAFFVAEGAIQLSMEVVDLADDVALIAQNAYSDAAIGLTKETEKLKHQKAQTEREAMAQALVCAEVTVAPVTIDTAAPLPPCKCYDEWWSGECGGESVTHFGCPATPCDNDPKGRWCATEPGCAEEESTFDGGWFYCGDDTPALYCKRSDGSQFVNQCVLDKFAADPNSNICGPCGCPGCPLIYEPGPQCLFVITVVGKSYGSYGPFKHLDACDATFTTPSEADSVSNGYECGSRFGLRTSLLRSSTGKMVGSLSCANQGFDVTVNSKTSDTYTSQSGVYCTIGSTNVIKFDNAPSLQECKDKCTNDASCVSVSYWPSHGECYPYSNCASTSVSGTDATTYHKKAVRRLEMLQHELPAPTVASS